MATSNIERIGKGLQILRTGLAPYIQRELKNCYKDRWWLSGVETVLGNAVGRDALTGDGNPEERFERLDVQAMLIIMWENWNNVFKTELGHSGRSYVSELREVRNNWAHQQPFNSDDTFRALDTMARLIEMISAHGKDELQELSREMLRQRFEADTKT